MNTRSLRGTFCLLFTLVAGVVARADWGPETIAFGAGLEEIFDQDGRRAVYLAEVAFPELGAGLAPVVEINVSEAGAVFAGAGLAWRWQAETSPVGVRVGLAPGYYEDGRDKFLGGSFQVLSFVEATWQLTDSGRLGVRLAHLSNASTTDINPGTEILSLVYEVRLR